MAIFEERGGPHSWTDAHFGFGDDGDDVEEAFAIEVAVDPYSIGQSLEDMAITNADDEVGALLYSASHDPYALGQPL